MTKTSSGLLIYRIKNGKLQVYLVHPGGPFFKKKDLGHWGIPKGEVDEGEDLLECAIREVKEEIGLSLERRNFIPLNSIKQKGGKIVYAWACEYNDEIILDNSLSQFEIEWPPASGIKRKFPEVDRGEFFETGKAREKIKEAQCELINRLENYLAHVHKK